MAAPLHGMANTESSSQSGSYATANEFPEDPWPVPLLSKMDYYAENLREEAIKALMEYGAHDTYVRDADVHGLMIHIATYALALDEKRPGLADLARGLLADAVCHVAVDDHAIMLILMVCDVDPGNDEKLQSTIV